MMPADSGDEPGASETSKADASGTVVAARPIAVCHGDDLDLTAAARSVDEAMTADVNTDMGERLAQGVEEYQVAGIEFAASHRPPRAAHLLRTAWQLHPQHLTKDIVDEPAAVETDIRRVAPELIGHADQAERPQHELGPRIAIALDAGRTMTLAGRLSPRLRLMGAPCQKSEHRQRES